MDRLVFTRVFRCIARRCRRLEDSTLCSDLGILKHKLRTAKQTRDPRILRGRVKALYSVERSLQDVEDKRLTTSQFRKVWSLDTVRPGRSLSRLSASRGDHGQPESDQAKPYQSERNQGGRRQLWLQQGARRFDKYNTPPPRGSEEFRRIDNMAKFMDTASRFSRKFKCSPRDPVVSTVLAPFWKVSNTRQPALKPRPVEVRSVKRSSGTLSLLRVRGVQMRGKGLRRYFEDIDKDRYSRLSKIDSDIWLAKQHALDPLDGEDMSEWIDVLSAERRRQKRDLVQLGLKLEVQRRILLRRRTELERDWEWRHRKRLQIIARQAVVNPRPLLTLATL